MIMNNLIHCRFKLSRTVLFCLLVFQLAGCAEKIKKSESTDIVIENSEIRLILGSDGTAKSLVYKPTGEECLMLGTETPAFAIAQDRPYDNEIQLAYPAKSKTFAADSIYRDGDNLFVGFELTDYEATIDINITDEYIGFVLKKLEYQMADFGIKRQTRIDEFTLLQLPVKNRAHFGEWLNVSWDENIAVNLLGSDPFVKIDAEERQGYKIFQAGGTDDVKVEGVGASTYRY